MRDIKKKQLPEHTLIFKYMQLNDFIKMYLVGLKNVFKVLENHSVPH